MRRSLQGAVLAAGTLWLGAPAVLCAQRAATGAHVPALGPGAVPLRVDAASRRVTYAVRAGVANAANPELNFNGAAMGEEELQLPPGWTVEVQFTNVGQAPHSMRLLHDAPIPLTPGPAAIAGAETTNGPTGLAPGASSVVRFTAGKPGRYRLSCAVSAHGYAGMWVRVVVSPRFTTAALVHHAAAP